jgi:hypothetical protein
LLKDRLKKVAECRLYDELGYDKAGSSPVGRTNFSLNRSAISGTQFTLRTTRNLK